MSRRVGVHRRCMAPDGDPSLLRSSRLSGAVVRMNDDGEPPARRTTYLEVIEREGLTNTVVVVTRYWRHVVGAAGLVRLSRAPRARPLRPQVSSSTCCTNAGSFDATTPIGKLEF